MEVGDNLLIRIYQAATIKPPPQTELLPPHRSNGAVSIFRLLAPGVPGAHPPQGPRGHHTDRESSGGLFLMTADHHCAACLMSLRE